MNNFEIENVKNDVNINKKRAIAIKIWMKGRYENGKD